MPVADFNHRIRPGPSGSAMLHSASSCSSSCGMLRRLQRTRLTPASSCSHVHQSAERRRSCCKQCPLRLSAPAAVRLHGRCRRTQVAATRRRQAKPKKKAGESVSGNRDVLQICLRICLDLLANPLDLLLSLASLSSLSSISVVS